MSAMDNTLRPLLTMPCADHAAKVPVAAAVLWKGSTSCYTTKNTSKESGTAAGNAIL